MTSVEIVKQILASDIIGWILAFLGGCIVYKMVDNMQTKLERHTVIKEIESTINELFSKQIAKANNSSDENNQKLNDVNIRTILHDKSPWEEYKNETKIKIDKSQRYVQIRSKDGYDEYISTQAIHESLILFRRIEKLYKDSIVKPIDLADLWRELLPFGTSGRLEFYKSYLRESDVRSIVFVLFNTILACEKYKIYDANEYFARDFFKDCLKEEKKKMFIKNNRYTFKERLKVKKFLRILENSLQSHRKKCMDIKIISSENRNQINEFIKLHWFSTDMVVRGEIVDMTTTNGFVMYNDGEIIGVVTYRIKASECEIMSLDSLREKQGIGATLLNKVIEAAKDENCLRVKLITTNDNINALRFYQKRGFDMLNLYCNALDISRKLKPSIPLTGDFGITLRHEIEMSLDISSK